MLFEQSEIIDLLKCENCSQQYDVPRILPCCDKTICNTCVQLIEKQSKNKFKCIVCKENETIPKNGFKINQLAVLLLKLKN
jgi:hypothetical protein